MGSGHASRTLDWLEHMPVETLAAAVSVGDLKPLLINDGHILGCENAETPGAATPRESR